MIGRRRLLVAASASAALGMFALAPGAQASSQFYDTPGSYSFVVPSGVTSLDIELRGAAGEKNNDGAGSVAAGRGGYISGTLTVTPLSTLYINVGAIGDGGDGTFTGVPSVANGGEGGGSSDVRTSMSTLSSRVLVAGGGGGAGGGGDNAGSEPQGVGGAGGDAEASGGGGSAGGPQAGGGGGSPGGAASGGAPGALGGLFSEEGGTGLERDGGNGGANAFTGGGASGGGGGGGDGLYGGGGGSSGGSACCGSAGVGGGGGGGGGSNYAAPAVTDVTEGLNFSDTSGEVFIEWAGPEILVNPESKDFGEVNAGSNSATETFTVENDSDTAGAPLIVSSVTFAGGNPGQFQVVSQTCTAAPIAVGDECEVQARFSPTSGGSKATNLRIASNDTDSPTDVALSGQGRTPAAFQSDPASHSFGQVLMGQSASQSFEITNGNDGTTAPRDMGVTSVSIVGPGAAAYQLVSETCTAAPIDPGDTCDAEVTFSPDMPGARNASLRFVTNDPGSPNDVALSGTGVVEPGSPFDNSFTIGGTQRNAKKGTAVLSVNVPGPGQVSLAGVGVASIAGAHASQQVPSAGTVKLTVRATGASAGKLRKKGKLTVGVTVTYTPAAGNAASQDTAIKLVRKKPKKKR